MNIGRLDERVEHHTRITATDAWNHETTTWGLNATVWADVTFRGGREVQSGEQTVAVDRVVFLIRHRSDVGLTDRIKWGGRYHDVEAIEIVGRREGMRLITTVRDNATSNI